MSNSYKYTSPLGTSSNYTSPLGTSSHNTSSPSKIDSNVIGFDSPSKNNHFRPSNYSSPVQPKSGYNRNSGNWRHNNYNTNKRYSYNANTTFNNSSRYNSPGSSQNKSANSTFNQSDGSEYLHPSFTENPWEALERQLKEEKR